MRIGVVRTATSPCRCAESVSAGLRALRHEPFIVDSAEIEIHASALARECDLVIDHTDTYCGRGLYRPMVRLLLEDFGARTVGSNAKACFLADNKAAAKERLGKAGIPVPPGVVINSKEWKLPEWLKPPLLLKPAFEHMSRGVCLAQTEREAYDAANRLYESLHQPVLVESYIPGRELAVSLLDGTSGLQVLPVLEWVIGTGEAGILTEDFKLEESESHSVRRADLPPKLNQELEELALHAFQTLNLRDYGRFDLRLSPGGSLFFLEANSTPSLETGEALAMSAEWAGLDYTALIERLLSAAHRRYDSSHVPQHRRIQVQRLTGSIELEISEGVHFPPLSSIELAGLLDVRPGDEVLDLGCGSGLLSIAAAKLGAKHVVATDIDPEALEATKHNARRCGVGNRIEVRAGSWYEALQQGGTCQFDIVIATPPQTPGRQPFGPKYGGPDGARYLAKLISGAPDFLKPERGRLWLMAISLANPRQLWKELREHFSEVVLVRETERLFTPDEYESMQKGLFNYLRGLRSSGVSEFVESENGQCSFRNSFIRAAKPRKI